MMTRTQIYLPQTMHETLTDIAAQENITLSEVIRKALSNLVKKHKKKKMTKKEALNFFVNFSKYHKVSIPGHNAAAWVREDRDAR